jgi:phenylalanyl-tRNA synthetase beta chain
MKVTLEWLSEFLPGEPLDAQRCAEALTAGGLPVENIETVGADTVLDVEVTSNRSDCLSVLGIAAELSALLDRPLRVVEPKPLETGPDVAAATSVRIDQLDLCPLYIARVIRDVKVGPSPAWMSRRLEAIGCRAISNIVDVTNYVLFELGQPLHAFDYDRLTEHRIVVRSAMEGETITSIDGHKRRLEPRMLVIADASKPVALAGVMGGVETEVSAQTVNVLLESARFDPLNIRTTARTLSMRSDSSYRFERGIDPTLAELASRRAAELFLQTAGGTLLRGRAFAGNDVVKPVELSLRLSHAKRLLGFELPANEVVRAFERLRLQPKLEADVVHVRVPSSRLDLRIETDLVEEAARVLGYDLIPMRETIELRVGPSDPRRAAVQTLRTTLAACGYNEAVTFSFASDNIVADFLPAEALKLQEADPGTRKSDGKLRPSILPGLLESLRHNESVGVDAARLFETGSVFWIDHDGLMVERKHVGLVGGDDYRATRGAVEALLNRLDAARAVRVEPAERAGFARGGCGQVRWGNAVVGWIGQVAPKVSDRLGLRKPPMAAELLLDPLLDGMQHVPQLVPPPKFPAVRRDLSLVVAQTLRYDAIDSLIRSLALPDLESVEYVTTYRGKPLPPGTQSVTVTLVFRSQSSTLTSDAVDAAMARVVDQARLSLDATVRA